MKKIAFIGAGNMASAIAAGILSSKITTPDNIILFDKNINQYDKFNIDCTKADSIIDAVELADYVFLSVKPQNIKDVLEEIKLFKSLSDKVFISICAGITIASIEAVLGDVKVARAMPNTPLLIGQGTTGICKNKLLTNDEFEFVRSFFASSGLAVAVEEKDIDNVTALTGSAPAYAYLFIKAATDAAKRLGFENENAVNMFCNTLIGSAKMVLESDKGVDELIKMVTSPNGTTERALNSFNANHFSEIVFEAMRACRDRAEELSKLN